MSNRKNLKWFLAASTLLAPLVPVNANAADKVEDIVVTAQNVKSVCRKCLSPSRR